MNHSVAEIIIGLGVMLAILVIGAVLLVTFDDDDNPDREL